MSAAMGQGIDQKMAESARLDAIEIVNDRLEIARKSGRIKKVLTDEDRKKGVKPEPTQDQINYVIAQEADIQLGLMMEVVALMPEQYTPPPAAPTSVTIVPDSRAA